MQQALPAGIAKGRMLRRIPDIRQPTPTSAIPTRTALGVHCNIQLNKRLKQNQTLLRRSGIPAFKSRNVSRRLTAVPIPLCSRRENRDIRACVCRTSRERSGQRFQAR